MDQALPTEKKQGFLQNDRRLVCSMFIVYGLCILGVVGGTIWGLDRRSKTMAANATSTAAAQATQYAKGTATVSARITEQAQYRVIEPFDNNGRGWFVETVNDEYMVGSTAINGGAYVWDIREVKQPFSYWAHFPLGSSFKDFDTYVDSKVKDDAPGYACSGFTFRTASRDWEKGTYIFSVCQNSYFYVSYYKQGKRENISDWRRSDNIRSFDWNRLEISARGQHFIFNINGNTVYEMDDDRLKSGGLALVVILNEKAPAQILFDNFGFQPR